MNTDHKYVILPHGQVMRRMEYLLTSAARDTRRAEALEARAKFIDERSDKSIAALQADLVDHKVGLHVDRKAAIRIVAHIHREIERRTRPAKPPQVPDALPKGEPFTPPTRSGLRRGEINLQAFEAPALRTCTSPRRAAKRVQQVAA